MDSLSLLLNLAAWVAYMGLRRGHFYAAIFCSSGLAATSLVTHPNGIIAFFGILVLAVVLDRSRLSVRSGVMMMVGAAGPLAAAASLILQAPAVWLQQMRAHSQYRFDGYLHPLE